MSSFYAKSHDTRFPLIAVVDEQKRTFMMNILIKVYKIKENSNN